MEKESGALLIAAACLMVLFLTAVKRKAELLINFLLRMVCGGIAICGINAGLAAGGIFGLVGINPVSLLTSGALGFSGVFLLFAISALRLL